MADYDRFAAPRHAPELLHDQAGDGVELGVGQCRLEILVELVDARATAYAVLPIGIHADVLVVLDVEFVVDVADDLLDDVFDGHQPGNAAIFVDHQRHVIVLAAKLLQQHVEAF